MKTFKKSYWYDGKLMKKEVPWKQDTESDVYLIDPTPTSYSAQIFIPYDMNGTEYIEWKLKGNHEEYDINAIEWKSSHDRSKIIVKSSHGHGLSFTRYVYPVYHSKIGLSIIDVRASHKNKIDVLTQSIQISCPGPPDSYVIIDSSRAYDAAVITAAEARANQVVTQYLDALASYDDIIINAGVDQENQPQDVPFKEPTRLTLPNGNPALRCDTCGNDFEYAEPNTNGSFVCSGCRLWN